MSEIKSEVAAIRRMGAIVCELNDCGFEDAIELIDQLTKQRDAAEAKLAHLSLPAQQVPDGWKLVPIEPTDAMIEVGCENNPTQWNEGTDSGFAADVANDVYVSMVRASAFPSTEGGGGK